MLSISQPTWSRGPAVAGWMAAAAVSLTHDPEAAPAQASRRYATTASTLR
jgi:hypothetical protein